jgi:hypothetical protein
VALDEDQDQSAAEFNVASYDGGTGSTAEDKYVGDAKRRERDVEGCAECRARWAREAEAAASGGVVEGGEPSSLSLKAASAAAALGRGPRAHDAQLLSSRYTVCDVRRRANASAGEVWLHAHGIVYDCGSFVRQHPGGPKSILSHVGQDCTEDFDFHSYEAQKQWRKLAVGTLAPCAAQPSVPGFVSRVADSCAIQ